MTVKYDRLKINPTLAQTMLEKNSPDNRSLKPAKVAAYARDMRSGNWNSNTGETIKFADDGTLLDGQNRLTAIIMAETSITFDVAYNVPKDAMHVMDTGATRTFGDVTKIINGESNNNAASVARWHLFWRKSMYTGKGGRYNPTHRELLTQLDSDYPGYDQAGKMGRDCNQQKLGPTSAFGIGFYLFEKIDHEDAYNWQKHLTTGANLSDLHPALILRNKLFRAKSMELSRGKQARYRPLEILAMNIRAWNHFRANETVKSLTSTGQSGIPLTNDNFPQPK